MLVSLDLNISLPGYHITKQIYSGSRTIVYCGIRERDQKPVIFKLMRNEYPTFDEVAQFRNQYTVTKNLNLPGIVKTYSLENYRNGYALIMEDFGGISLQNWRVGRGGVTPLVQEWGVAKASLQEFFPIAIQIVSTLNGLHRHRVIHKDIKPGNILIHPTTHEIRLIDFSIASLLPREIQTLTNPNVLEGTLAYISPEQTGRMNRGIDYRSDFYSLGVTFFELLTGQLPFTTTDPMELVYCHIAKQPANVSSINPNIPTVISDIISKLITKNAEDRYQSALGLRYDLEICQQQWQETGKIKSFKLGQQDISDRFLIPEKLYGRKHEIKTLLAAFDRVTLGKTEMILVAGASGIGKTAVVNEVHKPIVRQHSYFIKGKFDQFQRDIPFLGLVQAFKDLIGQLLSETDAQIQQWKAKILSALGEQGQVITDVIPKLELIIGKQPTVAELSGNAAQNRFNFLFQKFIQVFTGKEHPLVIFLDDLQWADAASLKFVQSLISESNGVKELETTDWGLNTQSSITIKKDSEAKGSFLLIGAYRDNEVSRDHQLHLTLNEIEKTGEKINKITLTNLNISDLNQLLTDTLHCSETVAIPLTKIVFHKTKGNPFFTNQLLKYLHEYELIQFNSDVGRWQCDLTRIQELSLTDDVVEFMALRLDNLPKTTQEVLKLAACIGNQFDLKTLAIVYQKSEGDTAEDLWSALLEGLILPESEGYKLFIEDDNDSPLMVNSELSTINRQLLRRSNYQLPSYKFVHDRVQQAAYSLIPQSQKQAIHLKIGQMLFKRTPITEREENIFTLVNQFNIAVELIIKQAERDELTTMNLIAGRRALASTAYAAAIKYLTTGIQLLTGNSWETKYDLTLALYETAAEAAYLEGDFEQMEQFIKVVLQRAKTLLEKVKVYEVKIKAYGAQNQALQAVNTALTFLKQLGVEFPESPSQHDVQLAMTEITSNLAGRQIEDLINLPEMTEAQPMVVMRLLSSATAFAYQAIPQLFPLFAIKQINLSIKHGNSLLSAYAYVVYGLILCGVVGDIEFGHKFGTLALGLLDKFNAKEVKAKNILTFNIVIRHYKEHVSETFKPLMEAYSSGMETGDLEFAAYSLKFYSSFSYSIGRELAELGKEMATYSNAIHQIKQETVFHWHAIYRQIVLNLLGAVEIPYRLIGESYDEEKMLPIHLEAHDGGGLLHLYFSKLHLCYLFQKYPQAVENATLAEKYLDGGTAQLVVPLFHFYDSLARLAVYLDVTESEQKYILNKVQANQEKMRKWAHHAPMNFLHKYYLVEAEKYQVLGQYLEAIDCYEHAVTGAKQHGYINEEALANELAAKFYLEWGKQKIAQTYLTDAYYCYVRWGAKAKVDDLAKRYPQLLTPILQPEKLSLSTNKKSTSCPSTTLSAQNDYQTVIGTYTSISDSLDFASVIKASQALSSEIEIERLLSTLMEVVMENAGACKCALILSEGSNLNLAITATSSSSTSASSRLEFQSIHLEASSDVPITLINYVKRTQEILVIDDATGKYLTASDDYIIREQPKSLLCMPILNQGELLGVLYLENHLTPGAFTRDRVEILKLLTTQAALSLKNAILYKNLSQANERLEEYSYSLQNKVDERTQELNEKNQHLKQTLEELQSTQTLLIQTEKMSSLGQMVAGIAHEINNPINFIHGNITHAKEYIQELLDLTAVYQQEYLSPSPLVKEKTHKIDLDFLRQDLPMILDSMELGTLRIRNIVLGLRNFSRLDEAEMKLVDIHEGIDNTLMILQHKLQAKSDCPEIEIIKEYGRLPEVSCYVGQLNQVFMNILSNAIDALEEMGRWGNGMAEKGKVSPIHNPQSTIFNPKIRIRTELTSHHTIKIQIADNGFGIDTEIQQKIFDPFFTTKPVGSGTGLGLSISYQIVVDKHKGKLICNSTPRQGSEFMIEIPIQQ